jgi:hypothetical protein
VKLVGSTEWPMPDDAWGIRGDLDEEIRFPRPDPTDVVPGDALLYYAVGGTKHVFATARVESKPVINDVHPLPGVAKKWPYAAKTLVDPSTKLKYVSSGFELDAIEPGLQANVGHGVSHFPIRPDLFNKAEQMLRRAQRDENSKLAKGWKP